MRYLENKARIAASASLFVALLLAWLYFEFTDTQLIVRQSTNASLMDAQQMSVAVTYQNALRHLLIHDTPVSKPVELELKTLLIHLRSVGIQATAISMVSFHPERLFGLYHWPGSSAYNPLLQIPTFHTSTSDFIQSWVFSPHRKQIIGAIDVSIPTTINRSIFGRLLLDQFFVNLWVIILTVLAVILFQRLLKVARKRPQGVASWVHALIIDPFVPPSESGGEPFLDPLTRVIMDMRSRVHVQEALLHTVVSSAPWGVLYLSSDGIVQMANEAMRTITGMTEGEMIGRNIGELVDILDVDDLGRLSHPLNILLQGETIRNIELGFSHRMTKESRWVNLSVIPAAVSQNMVTAFTLFAEDISTLRQWETFTQYTDRLSLTAELAASTAHEIRNPLTTVRGFLQLQAKRSTVSMDKDHFQIMISEIDRVDHLIREYLSLVKNPSAPMFIPTDVHALLDELLPLVTAEANMKGVEVRVLSLPDMTCMGNSAELKQVFLNLIKNALDATPSGGRLTIYGYFDDVSCTIAIQDTGCGMDEVKCGYIFKPFFTTKSTGSGLGLAVTKRIVESHLGSVSVKSTLGNGSTFFVSLPTLSQEAERVL